MAVTIVLDTKTNNVWRFSLKIEQMRPDWKFIRITPGHEDEVLRQCTGDIHLVTYTTGFGAIPAPTKKFLEIAADKVKSVSASGNMNWGRNFAKSADTISAEYGLPILHKFELSGTTCDVETIITKIESIIHETSPLDTAEQSAY